MDQPGGPLHEHPHELEPPRDHPVEHQGDQERGDVPLGSLRAHSTNNVLTNLINDFLADYYGAHNKSIEYTRKPACKNGLDRELEGFRNFKQKYLLLTRCTLCHFSLSVFEGLVCRNCHKVYHKYCFQEQPTPAGPSQDSSEKSDSYWACPDCRECRYCLSFREKQTMISCTSCSNVVHETCVFGGPTALVNRKKFICDECLKCHNCEAAIGEDFNEEFGVKVCDRCISYYTSKQYCPICLQAHLTRVKSVKTKKFIKDLFYCECGLWVHQDCDPLLRRNPENLSKARSKDCTYNCPKCRILLKKMQAAGFVEILIMLDKSNSFTHVASAY